MRLIDLDEFPAKRLDPDRYFAGKMYACGWNGVIELLEHQPTIDPETIPTEQRPKLRIGSSVYYVVRDNNWRVVEEKVAEVGVNGFFISNVKGGMEPDDYIPYADIGNEWFLEKEEAEQMAKTRKAEKMCCNCAYWDDIPFDGGCTCKQSEYYSEYPNETDSCSCFKERDENA